MINGSLDADCYYSGENCQNLENDNISLNLFHCSNQTNFTDCEQNISVYQPKCIFLTNEEHKILYHAKFWLEGVIQVG